jgi:hypothetical protein
MSKIGTGEGAQAYGHGLYFAENEGVAKNYRDVLANGPMSGDVAAIVRNYGGDWDKATKAFETASQGSKDPTVNRILSELRAGPPGHMYEVNINADPEHFLDWDKPLGEQSPQVQALARATKTKPEKVGSDLLAYIQSVAGGDKSRAAMASDQLRDAGIPGIKYLDQGSRTVGKGSHNYVVFDDKLIDIARKYKRGGFA